jgi:hypothetical protein
MISTSARYHLLTSNPIRTKETIESDPAYKRETDYYLANISKVKTIDEFVNNYRLFNYAMKAYGLQEMAYGKAFMKKMLEEGVASPTSMANKLTDSRYKEFVSAFDFAAKGSAATSASAATTVTVSKYMVQTLEMNEGKQNEGVQLALYFKRKASTVKTTMGLLADKALLKFVQTTFNIPTSASRADLDVQVRNLEKQIDIKDLQDPKKVEKLIQRFTVMWDMNNAAPQTTSPVLSLFNQGQTNDGVVGISADLMMSISKLRLGGM